MHSSIVGARIARVAALIVAATALACGGSGSSASTAPPSSPPPVPNGSTMNLSVTNNHFSPVTDSVAAGSNLTWTWNSCTGDGYGGSSCESHSVQFDDDGPSSSIKSSGTFSRMFADAGTYTYHCAVHGAAMSGTITVH
jgi:plastocyanin